LSSFGLNQYLAGAGLPTGANVFADSLGFSGLVTHATTELHDPDSSEASITPVLAATGVDLEDDLEGDPLELGAEVEEIGQVGERTIQKKPKKKMVKTRMVEKPKSVYERYPSFRPGRVLDFSELFKGFINRKSRVSKRPFHGKPQIHL
jgi:transcription initiation factor TFIID subunit 1, fungi type